MKTIHNGNPSRKSKAARRRKELKRLEEKFGKDSFQYRWANKEVQYA